MYIRESSFTARGNHDAAQGRGTVRAGVHTVDIHLFQKTVIYIIIHYIARFVKSNDPPDMAQNAGDRQNFRSGDAKSRHFDVF